MHWLTTLTAVGTAVGIYVSLQKIITTHRERNRRITVSLSKGFLASRGDIAVPPQLSEPMLFVKAANSSTRTITITSAGISLPRKKEIVFLEPQSYVRLPHDLDAEKAIDVWASCAELADQLRESGFNGKVTLRGYVHDALGTRYTSRPFAFYLDAWRSSSVGA